jgi:hypothetical protein
VTCSATPATGTWLRRATNAPLLISRELGDRHGAAKLLGRLADMWFAMGRTAGARELLHEAHAILVELNDREADLVGERVNAEESIVPTPTRR